MNRKTTMFEELIYIIQYKKHVHTLVLCAVFQEQPINIVLTRPTFIFQTSSTRVDYYY
jgi:hypothetical protein